MGGGRGMLEKGGRREMPTIVQKTPSTDAWVGTREHAELVVSTLLASERGLTATSREGAQDMTLALSSPSSREMARVGR